MSGDLEDFLRRAAERRKQKAAQQGGGGVGQGLPPRAQPAPEYTSHRSERQVRQHDDDVVMAQVVGDQRADNEAALHRKLTEAKKQEKRAKVTAANQRQRAANERDAQVKLAAKTAIKEAKVIKAKAKAIQAATTGNPAEELIKMLTKPGGIQQSILLREILERPDHRW
ncbi:hypothetical protein [Planctomycetes bacterium K23_9]|uniref:Uncharacterized protein n=1 Tax=Stieleria marina TaxID=1930275 RepID=A0A517NUU9_9BACT|nr:hypothetical protein K239x_28910 [Planctomycetes bacterium K23_9]